MKKCFSLALSSKGKNLPNPFVGAILYDEDKNEIISCGYHKKFGESHAEVNAIKNANGNTQDKTLIVNLEPCSHFGKTPPCADLIIKSKIKKVVMAQFDPNPLVQGRGVQKLKQAGIEVISGILEDEAKFLNKIFNKNQLQNKPYVMTKIASTLDSKIALENGKSKWITNDTSRNFVQKLRSEYKAIMSGSGTILKDNPRLNVRLKGKTSPIRIVFDPHGKIPLHYNVFQNDGTEVIWVTNSKDKTPKNVEKMNCTNFDELFKKLYKKGIYSVMVEAGSGLNSILFQEKEIDEINQFIAPLIFGSGLNSINGIKLDEINDCIKLKNVKIKELEGDILFNAQVMK
ncbi:bifunctional diaminohydroxyphosphoribosylaminopyrimidine deaminase/5-amino-6-(5-phosphoribosylamino)uracil reductase RibD [bacterium]|nr:bifunctional diaminohydroxyphosphoribosylaminopyrimidine deaminase/5-amino-6-(5-phosphoribosylamino)uracil reductase RibD [bacterium]